MSVVGAVYAGVNGAGGAAGAGPVFLDATTVTGDLVVTGTVAANSGSIVVSNDPTPGFSSMTLRPGPSNPGVAVPSFVFVANNSGGTPFLNITRTNMPTYPVETAVVLTAFPNSTTEFPSSISVNGVMTAKYQASVKIAGTDPANRGRSNYAGYPIYIFNAPDANGYYDIVLNTSPSSGGVICVIYDENDAATYTQVIRIIASDGTTVIGEAYTNGEEQNQIIAGLYVTGQSQLLRGILTPLNTINTITIPAAEADALHAATEEAKGFTKLPAPLKKKA